MAFTLTTSYSWLDGDVVTAVRLNSLPTLADGQTYGFGSGSVGAPSLSFSAESTLGFYRSAATVVGLSGSLKAINATTNTQLQLGQDSTHNINFLWTYNATPGSASAVFGTFGKTNDLTIQANNLNIDSASLAFAIQVIAAGRVRIGGGTDDGVNAFQVLGATISDRFVSNPSTLTYAASTAIDFTANDVQTETLAGNVTFTTSNKANGRNKTLRIIGDGSTRTLTFPAGWTFMNNTAPASLVANKTAVLTLQCFGTNDTDIVAAYIVQP